MGFGPDICRRPGTGWCLFVCFPLCFLSEKLSCNCTCHENDKCSLYEGLSSHLKTKQSYLIGTHVKSHNFCRFGERERISNPSQQPVWIFRFFSPGLHYPGMGVTSTVWQDLKTCRNLSQISRRQPGSQLRHPPLTRILANVHCAGNSFKGATEKNQNYAVCRKMEATRGHGAQEAVDTE